MLPRENQINMDQEERQSDYDPKDQTVTQSTEEPEINPVSQPTLHPDESVAGEEEGHAPAEWVIVRYDIGDPNPIGK